MRVTLREEDVIAIAEALRRARGGNYDDAYLRSFRELQGRFDCLVADEAAGADSAHGDRALTALRHR